MEDAALDESWHSYCGREERQKTLGQIRLGGRKEKSCPDCFFIPIDIARKVGS